MLRVLLVLVTIFLLPSAPAKPDKPTPGQDPLAGISACAENWPPPSYPCPPDCECP